MAQYHFAASIIQRSRGQSAVASAAYRAGELMRDDRLGKTFDYRRHLGVVHTEILAPDNAPGWMRDRSQLWNAVEKAEKRKDSQLARSLDIALPHELTIDLNLELLRGFVQEQWVDQGMIADIAIHLPGRTGDIRNVHAHIALTTREITGPGFGLKARDWNSKEELVEWRKAWADHANRILEREGFEERIDHRSLVDQGIDREPTTHVGPAGKEMQRRGTSHDRFRQNRDIKAANDEMALLKTELVESQKRLSGLRRQLAAEQIEQIQKTVRHADAIWEESERRWPPPPEPPAPATEPEPTAPTPPRRPTAAERIEQIQKTIHAADAVWKKGEQPQAPTPEPDSPVPTEPPAPTSEHPAEPVPSAPPPVPSGPVTRRLPPSRYALIDKQNYAARAKEEEEKKKADRERDKDKEKEKDERERDPDRER